MAGSIHEYQCKLYCLAIEAEYVIEMLLGFYSVHSNIATSNGITDPNEAFAAIVKHCNNNHTLKNVEKLSYLDYKQHCFDLNMPSQVKKEINIEELDITISYDFLRNLDVFPTCKERYKKNLKCKNLIMAGKHDLVCCNICLTCNNCLLLTPQCESGDIIKAVDFIKKVRNFTAHLKFASCVKMEKGDFSCIRITGCSTWNDVLLKYKHAIKIVLQYLRTVLGISIDTRCDNLDKIVTKNKEVYWNIYSTSSINTVRQENFDIVIKRTLKVYLCFTKVEAAGFLGCLSRVASLVTCHQRNQFNFTEEDLLLICNDHRESFAKTVLTEIKLTDNSGKFEIVHIVIESLPASELELLSICMSIHIEFHKEPPECYIDTYSIESRSLRNRIKIYVAEAVRNVLKLNVNVKCTAWCFH